MYKCKQCNRDCIIRTNKAICTHSGCEFKITTAGNPPYPWHKKDCMLFSITEHPHCTCGFDEEQAKVKQPRQFHFKSIDGGSHKVEVPEIDSKEKKLQDQVDLLVLGLLQENRKVSALLEACENLVRGQLQHPTFEGYVRHAVAVAETAISKATKT